METPAPSPRGEEMRPLATTSVFACSVAEGRLRIVDGEADQLVAGGQRRLVHGAGHDPASAIRR